MLNVPGNLFLSLHDAKPPLLLWIFGLFQYLFSNPLLAGRLVSSLAGTLSLTGVYLSSKLLFDKKTATISSLIYIFAPLFVFYDRLATLESSLTACGVWSFYFLNKLLTKGSKKYAYLLGICFGLGLFIKTSAYVFVAASLITSIYLILKKRIYKYLVGNIFISLLISQIILIPIYLQEKYWATLSTLDRYTLSFADLARFPFSIWIKNISGALDILFWKITPAIFASGVVGALIVLKLKSLKKKSMVIWLFIAAITTLIISKGIQASYLVSTITLFCILSGYSLSKLLEKNLYLGAAVSAVFLIPSIVLSITLITNHINYFNYMEKVSSHSQKTVYVTNWTSGYGITETVNLLKNEAKNKRVIAGVRLDAGNPESAIFAYFNSSKQIKPIYLDSKMFSAEILDYDCYKSSLPLYFVSRDGMMAGFNKYFEEIERYYKPEGKYFISIHILKTNCVGESVNLF
jgi:4-amino-4-deoxy-L-arabinose transferase-like glycosyltransferase